jgi:hypothetical protein
VIITPTHWRRPLGDHGEEDEPAGEDCLHDRQRRERERADVKAPGEDRHDPPDREPPGAEEIGGGAQRMAYADRRSENRAAVLEQEGDVGAQRRSEGQEQAQDHRRDAVWATEEKSNRMREGCGGV